MIDVDSLLVSLKPKGFFQLTQYLLSDASMIPCVVALLKIVFIGSIPTSRCANLNISQLYDYGYESNDTHDVVYGKCQIEIFSRSSNSSNRTLACINGYTYDEGKHQSFVSEWDLVCDKAGLSELTQTLFSVGGLIGALTLPYFSDTKGRKPVLVISNILLFIFSFSSSFSPNYYVFIVFRVLEGISMQGLAVATYTLMLELYPVSHRTLMSGMSGVTWGLCVLPFAPVAYLLRNYSWKINNIVYSSSHVIVFFQLWYLEESLRWLVTNGDFERSKKVIKRVAKENGVDFGPIWDKIETNLIPLITVKNKDSMISSKEKLSQQQEVKKEGYLTIFTNSLARRMTLILFVVGFMNAVTYIAVYMTSPSLAGNGYLNFFLFSLTEVCANITMAITLFRLPRRVAISFYQGTAGVALFIAVAVLYFGDGSSVYSILNIIFSLLGMFGISASYCLIWIYAPEIYPTNLRNIGLGFLTFSGSVGNMVSPYSRLLMENIPWLPGTVCSIGCILSFSLLYFMPESQKMQMPSSMSDVKAHMKLQKRSKREKSGKEIGSTDPENT
ncbi:solute carrier family 22 member 8-like isoform X2 [Octopus sinensis]|uniref:Solute carrier family 22 member 8-like isoform X2 n=1 Tax=Octopus sinensis TaxID=2607531 RepID=A0A7E6EK64_9MOLL|nr:solute carrier family 22 member 8-like isoform X2 [Octopus sinensis]